MRVKWIRRKFINVIVGDIDVPQKTYLIECCVTETVNQSIICMKIDNILRKLDIARENFLLLLSDAARYMTACTATLKVPFMLHAAQLCGKKCAMLSLMSTISLPVLKWPLSRTSRDRHMGSPSEPAVTRWGTWLKAADYYADNLIEVKKIVNEFEGDGIFVKRAKEAMNDAGIAASLLKIKRDYSQLPKIIQKIESPKFAIVEARTANSGKFYSGK